jgi:hypothetical protein
MAFKFTDYRLDSYDSGQGPAMSSFEPGKEQSCCIKRRGVSGLAERLSAPKEGLCLADLATYEATTSICVVGKRELIALVPLSCNFATKTFCIYSL